MDPKFGHIFRTPYSNQIGGTKNGPNFWVQKMAPNLGPFSEKSRAATAKRSRVRNGNQAWKTMSSRLMATDLGGPKNGPKLGAKRWTQNLGPFSKI